MLCLQKEMVNMSDRAYPWWFNIIMFLLLGLCVLCIVLLGAGTMAIVSSVVERLTDSKLVGFIVSSLTLCVIASLIFGTAFHFSKENSKHFKP